MMIRNYISRKMLWPISRYYTSIYVEGSGESMKSLVENSRPADQESK